MTQIYFVPVDDDWMDWFNRTVERPVELADTPIEELRKFEEARVWGTTRGKRKRPLFEEMKPRDAVMFYKDREFFATGRVGVTFQSEDAGEWLWNNPKSPFIYTVDDYQNSSIPIETVNEMFGYSENNLINGFTRPSENAVGNLLNSYVSLDRAFDDLRNL